MSDGDYVVGDMLTAETSGPGQQGTHVGLYTLIVMGKQDWAPHHSKSGRNLYQIRTVCRVWSWRPCKSAARGASTLEAGWADGCRPTLGMGTRAEAAVTRQAAYVMLAPVTSWS